MGDTGDLLTEGRAALAACDWVTARSCFERVCAEEDAAEAVDGLGQALYWLGEYPQALALRERAYRMYRGGGDHRPAARVAIQLAALHGLIYGNGAAVSGWIAHAQRMVDQAGDGPEAGWVELFRAVIARDPDEREQHATTAVEVGRRFADPGLEFDALGYVGKARVERGDVEGGMRLIDEAVAATTSGVVDDPWAVGEIYCTLFHACEMTIDVKRADGWLGAVDNYVARTGELPISGICRAHYGGLLTAAGRWQEAERELLTALHIYDDTYRGTRFEPVLRLADLRARQGRLEEAARLVEGYEGHPQAAVPLARLRLAHDQPDLALAVIERHLARRGRGVAAGPVLAVLVEVQVTCGDLAAAAAGADELEELAAATGQASIAGLAALSRARVAAAAGEDAAVRLFEEALAAFTEAELPCDAATARLHLAELLAEQRPEVARAEAHLALACFQEVGAAREADAAANLLRRLGGRGRSWPRGSGTLTKRETEVLDLLAEGLSNAGIAERLYISPRTAEHHVSNILSKLGLSSRAEATAYALRHASPTTDRGSQHR